MVSKHVAPEGARLSATVGTHFASVRLLPSVDEDVSPQCLFGGRSVLAEGASKRLLSCVFTQVIVKVEFLECGIPAVRTLVQLHTRCSGPPTP